MLRAKIRVLVADSQRLNAEALASALRYEGGFDVIDEHPATGIDAVETAARLRPDVSLIDYWMPDMEGAAAAGLILARRPGLKIILLSWFYSRQDIEKALSEGAVGFLPRTLSLGEVISGIKRAYEGESPVYLNELGDLFKRMSIRSGQGDLATKRLAHLTRRELELLALLSLHLSVNEVADRASISPATVKAHIRNILTKTGTGSTKEVLHLAIQAGVIRT